MKMPAITPELAFKLVDIDGGMPLPMVESTAVSTLNSRYMLFSGGRPTHARKVFST